MTDVWQNISKEKHADVKAILYVKIPRGANLRGLLQRKNRIFRDDVVSKNASESVDANAFAILEEPNVQEDGRLRALNTQRKILQCFRYIF